MTENIALRKPTYQENPLSTYSHSPDTVDSSNAVDGLRSSLTVWSGQCANSDDHKTTAILWVNLTNVLSIHHITIYYMTGDSPWGKKLKTIHINVLINLF